MSAPVENLSKDQADRASAALLAEPVAEQPPAEIAEVAPEPTAETAPEKPKRSRRKKPVAEETEAAEALAEPAVQPTPAEPTNDASATSDEAPPRRGWWQRTFGE